MHKRLMEIVLYILDKVDEDFVRSEGGAEELKTLLSEAGFEREDILRALRFTILKKGEADSDAKGMSVSAATLSREAWDYLERLRRAGLISDEESGELLFRAADLPSENVDLESIRFMAASIIFDREGGRYGSGPENVRIH